MRARSPRAIRPRGRSPRALRTRGRSPRAIRKIASSRLSAATQLPFAHEMALPSSICTEPAPYASVKPSPHKSTGELMYTQYLVSFN